MPICPRCENQVKSTDLVCSYCRLQLKAHGHPSIDLHQSEKGTVLCKTCAYDVDDSCTFPQRPYARTCTLYQSVEAEAARNREETRSPSSRFSARLNWQRYRVLLILLGIFAVSLMVTIL